MTSRLQSAAYALLGALDLKVGGDNPASFGGELGPTIDTTPFYLAKWMQLTQASTTLPIGAVANGTQTLLTVPAGFAWYVYAASASLGLAAGDTMADSWPMYVGYRFPASVSNDMPLAVGPPGPKGITTGSISLRAAVTFPQGLLLQPGSSLIARTCGQATLTAQQSLVCAALYAQVPI